MNITRKVYFDGFITGMATLVLLQHGLLFGAMAADPKRLKTEQLVEEVKLDLEKILFEGMALLKKGELAQAQALLERVATHDKAITYEYACSLITPSQYPVHSHGSLSTPYSPTSPQFASSPYYQAATYAPISRVFSPTSPAYSPSQPSALVNQIVIQCKDRDGVDFPLALRACMMLVLLSSQVEAKELEMQKWCACIASLTNTIGLLPFEVTEMQCLLQDFQKTKASKPDIFRALSQRCRPLLIEILIDLGVSTEIRDGETGNTPLIFLLKQVGQMIFQQRNEDIELAKVLVKRGARLDAVDREGIPALFWALNKHQWGIVEFLIYSGAPLVKKIEVKDRGLVSAHHIATKLGHEETLRTMIADTICLRPLANESTVDVNRRRNESDADARKRIMYVYWMLSKVGVTGVKLPKQLACKILSFFENPSVLCSFFSQPEVAKDVFGTIRKELEDLQAKNIGWLKEEVKAINESADCSHESKQLLARIVSEELADVNHKRLYKIV